MRNPARPGKTVAPSGTGDSTASKRPNSAVLTGVQDLGGLLANVEIMPRVGGVSDGNRCGVRALERHEYDARLKSTCPKMQWRGLSSKFAAIVLPFAHPRLALMAYVLRGGDAWGGGSKGAGWAKKSPSLMCA